MKKYETYKKHLTIRTEQQLVDVLNEIRNKENILGIGGYFDLNEIKKLATKNSYTFFSIPKKRGGKRQICSPDNYLAFLQLCIAVLLNSLYKPNENVFGFVNGKSIVDNAKKHCGKQFILNIDLKDFFNSITEDLVIEKLIRQPYYFSYGVAKLISDLVTVQMPNGIKCLPQGAPSSPLFTNIVADHMDVRLSRLSDKYGMTYTRYADDMTFSFDLPVLKKLRKHGKIKNGIRDIIQDIIKDEGFEINQKKCRFSFTNQQHEVTGLIVNEKVNVRRQYIKQIRTEIHNWEKDGYIKASFNFFRIHQFSHKGNAISSMENVIYGKLSFIRMVKGANDPTYLKLAERYKNLYKRDKQFIELSNIKSNFQGGMIDNIFEIRPSKRSILNKKNSNGEYPCWKEIGKRGFTEKEKSLIISSEVISSEYGSSVKFVLRNGKTKYIPVSSISVLCLGEEIDMTNNKVLILSNGYRYIYRIL